jgi:hypothetical protein
LFIPRFSGATYGDTIYIKMRSVHNFMRLWWVRKGILNLLKKALPSTTSTLSYSFCTKVFLPDQSLKPWQNGKYTSGLHPGKKHKIT